jgi:hypothetical protein
MEYQETGIRRNESLVTLKRASGTQPGPPKAHQSLFCGAVLKRKKAHPEVSNFCVPLLFTG